MTAIEYIKKALRSESKVYQFDNTGDVSARIEHAVLGIASESGELVDAIKKSKIYNKQLDKVNLVEEMGDMMWYLALLCDDLGVSFEQVWEKNINKLKIRYPEKYSHDKALKRDLDSERALLEA